MCLHYLLYYLLQPICNGWSVAEGRQWQKKNRWKEIRVELSPSKLRSLALVYRGAQQSGEVGIAVQYLVKAVSKWITNGRQCPIIISSLELRRRVNHHRDTNTTQRMQKVVYSNNWLKIEGHGSLQLGLSS